MEQQCIYPHPFMVSPCGFYADFYERGSEPEGWTDVSQKSDAEVGALMMRRMKDADKEKK